MIGAKFSPAPKLVGRCYRCGALVDGQLEDLKMWDTPWTDPAEHPLLCSACKVADSGEQR